MNNARTIAALEKSIAQLTKTKERLLAEDAKASGTPAKKAPLKKAPAKRTMTPEHKDRISAAQKRRFSQAKPPAKKTAS